MNGRSTQPHMQVDATVEEFDRDDMDAADALFALAQQNSSRNVARKTAGANQNIGGSDKLSPVGVKTPDVPNDKFAQVKALPIAVQSCRQAAGLWLAQQQALHDVAHGGAGMLGAATRNAQQDRQHAAAQAQAFPAAMLAAGATMNAHQAAEQHAASEKLDAAHASVPPEQQAAFQQHLQMLLLQTLAAQQRQPLVHIGQGQQMGHDAQHHQMHQYPPHMAGAQQPGGNPLCVWVPSKAPAAAGTLETLAAQANMAQLSAQQNATTASLFSTHSALTGRGGLSSLSNKETATNGPLGGNTSSDSGPSLQERGARHVYISRMIERAASASAPLAMKNHEGTGSGGEEVSAENCTKASEAAKSCVGDEGEPVEGGSKQGSGNNESKACELDCTAGRSHISGRAGGAGSDDECTQSVRGDDGTVCQASAVPEEVRDSTEKPGVSSAATVSTAPLAADTGASVQGVSVLHQGATRLAVPCMTTNSSDGNMNRQGSPMVCLPAGTMLRGLPVSAMHGGMLAGNRVIAGPVGQGFTIAGLQQSAVSAACNTRQQSHATSTAVVTEARNDARAYSSGELVSEKLPASSTKQQSAAENTSVPTACAAVPSTLQGTAAAAAPCTSKLPDGGTSQQQQVSDSATGTGSPVSAAAHQSAQKFPAAKQAGSPKVTKSHAPAAFQSMHPVAAVGGAEAHCSGLGAAQVSVSGSSHLNSSSKTSNTPALSPLLSSLAAPSVCLRIAPTELALPQRESGVNTTQHAGASTPAFSVACPTVQTSSDLSAHPSCSKASDSQMLASMMHAQGMHMHGATQHTGLPQGMSLPAGMGRMQVVQVPGANGQPAHVLIPAQGAFGMGGGMHAMMAPHGAMGFVRGPQGQLLQPVLQQQPGTVHPAVMSGAMNKNAHAADKASPNGDKGSPTGAAEKQGLELKQVGENSGAGALVNAHAAVQHAQAQAHAQAQLQGLVALPAGAFAGGMGAAQMLGSPGGLCFVPRNALPPGAQGMGAAGMHVQGGWLPQISAAAAVGMQKPFVTGADFMQLQAQAQGPVALGMQWPQGRCV